MRSREQNLAYLRLKRWLENPANRAKANESSKRIRNYKRRVLISALGAKCSNPTCEWGDDWPLKLHHIHRDGKEDIRRFGSGVVMESYYFKHIEEAKKRLQLLCQECHKDAHHINKAGIPLYRHTAIGNITTVNNAKTGTQAKKTAIPVMVWSYLGLEKGDKIKWTLTRSSKGKSVILKKHKKA